MPPPARDTEHGPAWLVQAALVARRFYLEDRSKVEIAEELGLSRFKVARILEEARELGLVEVTVRLPARIDAALSTSLTAQLGLRRAIVVARPPGEPAGAVRDDLGRVAADLLTELVTDGDVLGLSCSRSVTATTQALGALARCDVVQLTGTLANSDLGPGSVESVRHAATLSGGTAFPIYAPMLLPHRDTARSLATEPGVRRTLARVADVTVAAIAIGGWGKGCSTVWEAVPAGDRRAATRAGAVGEIGGRIFDRAGAALPSPVDERVLGATLAELRGIDEVIGMSHGSGRAEATRAAAAAGLVSSLVCDEEVARALLEVGPVRTGDEA